MQGIKINSRSAYGNRPSGTARRSNERRLPGDQGQNAPAFLLSFTIRYFYIPPAGGQSLPSHLNAIVVHLVPPHLRLWAGGPRFDEKMSRRFNSVNP